MTWAICVSLVAALAAYTFLVINGHDADSIIVVVPTLIGLYTAGRVKASNDDIAKIQHQTTTTASALLQQNQAREDWAQNRIQELMRAKTQPHTEGEMK